MNKKEIGSFGERQAVRMLQEKGFRILDTNWSCAGGRRCHANIDTD
jgi:Holliday junction resolvase-like predicted endonuclease